MIDLTQSKVRRQARTNPSLLVVVVLALSALLQAAAIATSRGEPAHADGITVGDDLSQMSLEFANRIVTALDPQPMLLLIFDPECPHSRHVAPLWSEWLTSDDSRELAVLGIAPQPIAAAAAYAREQRWSVRVASIFAANDPIARRTPWVVAVDSTSRVLREEHGRKVAEVARWMLDIRKERRPIYSH